MAAHDIVASATLQWARMTAFRRAAETSREGEVHGNCSGLWGVLKALEKPWTALEHHFPKAGMAARAECSFDFNTSGGMK